MRILWISHDPIQDSGINRQSSSGFWKEALLELLVSDRQFVIKVAYPGKNNLKTQSGNYTFNCPVKKIYTSLPKDTLKDLKYIINDFKPDLIHIHGTEKPYGLITKAIQIPVLISLQGFISECYNSLLGEIALPVWAKEKTFKEYIFRNSFIDLHRQWYYNSAFEKEIVITNKYFAGRTEFDKNFVFKHNPNAQYYNGNELLRDEFYQSEWDITKINRHTIYTSSFTNPLKGFHVLLKAASYLKKDFPDLKIIVPGKLNRRMFNKYLGNSYFRIIQKMIDMFDLKNSLIFAGKLDGSQICQMLETTHVFVLPSFIENSSNALGEAQIVGTPCVVSSNCGGITSIIKQDKNGLFFNKGDAYDLSQKIREIFLNDELSIMLSKNSRIFGKDFHSKEKIMIQYRFIYQSIINHESTTK